jgi:hypothetical protein
MLVYNVLLWNYSAAPVRVDLAVEGAPANLTLHQLFLDAAAPSDDENARLRPLPSREFKQEPIRIQVDLGAYGIGFLGLEKNR